MAEEPYDGYVTPQRTDDRAAMQGLAQAAPALCDVTIVVPTRNEASNVAPLVARLRACLTGGSCEILFVDDSSDDTPERVRALPHDDGVPVRLLHREPAQRSGGLGGAVLDGLKHSRGRWVVVMDGDLQHPPEVVPLLLARGLESDADVVVASRYVGAGKADGLSSVARERVSGFATHLAKAMFPYRLQTCTDPMSGFFALRRTAVDVDRLRPRGFKILLEILARSPALRVCECPFTFEERLSGTSKASLAEGVLYVRRLAALRLATVSELVVMAATVTRFAAVGVTGVAVNSAVLWMLVAVMGVPVLPAAALATQVSTTWNFVLTDRLVFTGDKRYSVLRRFAAFAAINNLALVARLPLLAWLVQPLGVDYLLANVLTLLLVFAARFILSDRLVFRTGAPMTSDIRRAGGTDGGAGRVAREERRHVELVIDVRDDAEHLAHRRLRAARGTPAAYLEHRYDIHGLVTVGSSVALPELEYFRSPKVRGPFDIEIRQGQVSTSFRRRSRVTQQASPPAVMYQEHLGRLGSDFSVEMGDSIQVTVGPLLVKSPHVLYTNVLEALLRFVFVSRGHMLLHSACLELDGQGVMLSALTDTGKTGTILRLLREKQGRFLSDDMTILAKDGTAFCYPKPLTISQHTLRAVDAGELTRREWRRLRVQSRLHSKEGRGIGTWLGELNVPIMSLNALTQFVVPPPKYVVDRLVPCDHCEQLQVGQLFIIERRDHDVSDIDDREQLLDELIANTDDAYGFPPFRYFAPALVVAGLAYEELRAQERAILEAALRGVRARRLATPDYSWADRIPALMALDGPAAFLEPDRAVPLQRPEVAEPGRI